MGAGVERPGFATARAARALIAVAAAAVLLLAATEAGHAGSMPLSANCRVPDVYLKLPGHLPRTERLADRDRPVRVMVFGPAIGGPNLSPKRRSRLEHELERRLGGVQFTILDEGSAPQRLAQDDFERMRAEVSEQEPDLVLWQVGTPDAMAAIDAEAFGTTLSRAARWLKNRGIDFVLIDPPFDPRVQHEKLYWKIVGKIGEVSDHNGFNVFRRYAAMQYLEAQKPEPRNAPAFAANRRACMSELVAEAIVRAVLR